jgi:carboxyl-terminal processing protease
MTAALSTLLSLPLLLVPLPQDDARDILEEKAAAAAELDFEQIWSEAQAVARVFGDELGAPFDAEVDRQLALGKAGPRGVLFLVATRLLGDEPDFEVLAAALTPVLGADDTAAAVAAADLISTSGFDRQSSELRETLADTLIAIAVDEGAPAELRVQAAVAGYQIGLGSQVPKPRAVLYQFLESADPDLRARGALAMAHLGIIEEVGAVESELERLAGQPGNQGRLAAAYLKQLQIRRYKDTELRRARERQGDVLAEGAVGRDLERVERLIDFVQRYHLEGDKATREELVSAALDGILQRMDRHSSYFSSEAYKRFEQDLEAEYGGIGAYVGIDREDGLFTITRPIYSGPAYEAGLTTDDKIVRIDDWPTVGEEVDDVIKRLKGRPNTDVTLYVWRRGMDPSLIDRPSEDMRVTIGRAAITIPPVHYEMLPGNVGLIELTTFSRVASQELLVGLDELLKQGAEALVLDLRNNTGGFLTEAQNVADLFLPADKVVVRTESRIRPAKDWKTSFDPVVPADMPVAVLINSFSASAAEIVAGALQDHDRATLVGQRSFGKGSVQDLLRLPGDVDDGFADENGNKRYDSWETLTKDQNGNGEFDYAPRIKLTIERYLLPTGRSIHRELDDEGDVVSAGGVEPTIEVAPLRREQWRLVEMRRIQDKRVLRPWVNERMAQHGELFAQLALYDHDDYTRYPDFDELYDSLGTVLSKNEVRFLLRLEVRRAVQDARGHAFPLGDFPEDIQLQQAIAKLLEELGRSYEEVEAYAATFDSVDDASSSTPPAVVARAAEVREALDLIADADEQGTQLSKEQLQELRSLLESLGGKKN